MTFPAGQRLGPYEIVAPIGAGGMGEVFRARDTRLGRDVALKILPALFSRDPERLRRFEQEARAAAALNHPNILVVHDVSTDPANPYVVTELLEGQTLRQIVERGPVPTRKAVDYGIQIASGLAAAHERGILHRDLKPENLFVSRDGRVKILDFGLAKLVEEASSEGSRATIAHTDPGMVVGTAGYMSPEQLRGEPVDARSDVFSLGAVLYELFAGARAFQGKTAVDTMSAVLKEDPPDFPPRVHAAAPAIERIVRRCLEKNLEERFQSARDVMFALDAVSTASGSSPVIADATPARPRRRWPLAAAVAASVVTASAAMYDLGTRARLPAEPPAFSQLTFRNGTVRGARFAPDGRSVVYAAAWEGEPLTLYTTREGSPESSPLPLPSADLLALSRTGEMALALSPRFAGPFAMRGILARASLAGGAPRELMEDISSADWAPDGSSLAAIRSARNRGRLEFPLGTERVSAPYWLSDARVSPDGEQVAFVAHVGGGDDGDVQVVGRTGSPRTISKGWLSVQGLAWAHDGKEVWLTGTRRGMLRALWAVTLDGRERLLYRAPIRLTLQDIAADGRVLLIGESLRTQVFFGSVRGRTLRSLSWFDWATSLSLSADGRLLAFAESGEGAGSTYGLFIRPTDGSPATRIADGPAGAISPDGKWVLSPGEAAAEGRLIPTGAGTTRILPSGLALVERGDWSPDGARAILIGAEQGHRRRTYELDLASGRMKPLTPEGKAGTLVSPDGRWLLVHSEAGHEIYDLATGTARPLAVGDSGGVLGWSADAADIFVFERDNRAAELYRVNRATGARTLVTTVKPDDPAGSLGIHSVALAADGDHFAYTTPRALSGLFVVQLPAR